MNAPNQSPEVKAFAEYIEKMSLEDKTAAISGVLISMTKDRKPHFVFGIYDSAEAEYCLNHGGSDISQLGLVAMLTRSVNEFITQLERRDQLASLLGSLKQTPDQKEKQPNA